MIADDEIDNYELFRDCLSTPLVEKFAHGGKKERVRRRAGNGRRKGEVTRAKVEAAAEENEGGDAEELADFIDYLATAIFTSFPSELRSMTYSTYLHNEYLKDRYAPPLSSAAASDILQTLDPSVTDSLTTYTSADPDTLLSTTLTAYLTHLTTPPPPPSQTRASAQSQGCEICLRTQLPLTYHHLIPRSVHAKVLKRGWHPAEDLNNVAWLCRQCHSFVHRCASNEELAREWYTVELLTEREDVRGWAGWVGRVRWKHK